MPRNPKPGKPLGRVERKLAAALPKSSSISEAGRKIGIEPDAAHSAYKALLIKAPERCEQLGISRDRVLKRFEDWADNATREQYVSQTVFEKGGVKTLNATDLKIKANTELAKIMNLYGVQKIELDVKHVHSINLDAIPEAVLLGVIEVVEGRSVSVPEDEGRLLQAESRSVVTGQ